MAAPSWPEHPKKSVFIILTVPFSSLTKRAALSEMFRKIELDIEPSPSKFKADESIL